MAEPHAPVLEQLLAESRWLRRMARSLVADPDLADEITQRTWLAALRSPPRDVRSPRGWLATVARNAARRLGRAERRREARESAAPPPAPAPDPAALAAGVELQRRVASAVLELAEPYRSAVILRYFEGRSPKEIAAMLSIPAATVRTRLRRALEKLRARLDEDYGEGRRAWVAVLTPLLRGAGVKGGAAAAPTGALLLGAKTWIALAALAAGAAVSLLALSPATPPSPPPAGPTLASAPEPTPPPGPPAQAEAPAEEPEENADEGGGPLEPAVVRGRVVTEDGSPVARARIYVVPLGGKPVGRCSSREDGAFVLFTPRVEDGADLVVDAAGFLPEIRPLGPIVAGGDGVEIAVRRGLTISGVVRDETGRPVKTSVRAVRLGGERGPEGGFSRSHPHRRSSLGFADELGEFEIGGLAPGRHRVEKATANYRAGEGSVVECVAGARDVTLVIYRAVALTLRIRHAGSDRPVREWVTLTLVHEGGETRGVQSKSGDPVVRGLRAGKHRLVVHAPNYEPFTADLELDLEELAATRDVPLVPTGDHGFGAVRGTVVWPDGEVRGPAKVRATVLEVGMLPRYDVDESGGFEIRGLPAGAYRVHAASADGRWCTRYGRVEVRAGGTAAVTLRAEPAGGLGLRLANRGECREEAVEVRLLVEGGILACRIPLPRADPDDPAPGLELGPLVAGPVRLLAVARGRILAERETVVVAGSAATVELRLRESADGAPAAPPVGPPEVRRPAEPPAEAPPGPEADEAAPAEVARLAAKLSDREGVVRFRAVQELGKLGHAAGVKPLAHALGNDPDLFVRRAAAMALEKLGRTALPAVPDLIRALGDRSRLVAAAANRALLEVTGRDYGYREGMTKAEVRKLIEEALREREGAGGR